MRRITAQDPVKDLTPLQLVKSEARKQCVILPCCSQCFKLLWHCWFGKGKSYQHVKNLLLSQQVLFGEPGPIWAPGCDALWFIWFWCCL